HRHPELRVLRREIHSRGEDADNRVRDIVQPNDRTQHPGIASEAGAPERLAEDDGVQPAWRILTRGEPAPEDRCDAEERKEILRRLPGNHMLRLGARTCERERLLLE